MTRTIRTRSALICVSVCLIGHICGGQVSPPPPQTTPPAARTTVPAAQTTVPAAQTTPAVPASAATANSENAPAQAPTEKPVTTPVAEGSPATSPAQPQETPTPKDPPDKDATIPPVQVPAVAPSASAKTSATAPKGAPAGKPYVIGSMDVLEVKIWKSPNLSSMYDVGSDGTIFIPLLGTIQADGFTLEQLRATIRDRLAEKVFAQAPDIDEIGVQVVRYNSKKYYVYGGVNRPGEFPLLAPTTILDVIASCGGFQPFAKVTKIYLARGDKKFMFNYKQVKNMKKMEQNIQVQNGDRIFVPDGN